MISLRLRCSCPQNRGRFNGDTDTLAFTITVEESDTGHAPADQAAFDALVVGKQIGQDANNRLIFLSPGRIREIDGGTPYEGNYKYENTGANTGTLTYTFDVTGNDPAAEKTVMEMTFTSEGAGTLVSTYTEAGSRPEVISGPFELADTDGGPPDSTDYKPLEGLRVSRGRVQFGFSNTGGCDRLSNASINGVVYTVHTSKWQRRANADSSWEEISGTEEAGGLCAYRPTSPGEYRMIADITIDGTRGRYSSENTFTITVEPPDTMPSFATGSGPGNQTYTVGTAIDTLILPEASGGDGTLTYSLSPSVAGLAFNARARQLTGRPTTAGTYNMTYTVRDADGDTDSLRFTITVEESDDDAMGASYAVNDTLPGVPTSGGFSPSIRGGGSLQLTGGRTTINLNNGAYIELNDGTRYTCTAAGGCTIVNGTVTQGLLVGNPAQSGGFAPSDEPAFNSLVVGNRFHAESDFLIDFPSAGRFILNRQHSGSYSYLSTSSNTGTLTLTYDGGQFGGSCTFQLTFDRAIGGMLSYTCAEGSPGQSLWTITAADVPPKPVLVARNDTDPGFDVIFVDSFAPGETRAYDYQIRKKAAGEGWRTFCDEFTNETDNALARGITRKGFLGLEPATVYQVRYRYRNSSSCDSGSPGIWSLIGEGTSRAEAREMKLDSENQHPAGIAHANGLFFVVDWIDDKVYTYTTAGERRPDSDFDLDPETQWAHSIVHVDGILYVGVRFFERSDKVFAYTVSGERRPGLDFDLIEREPYWPSGLAFTEGRFYIVDQISGAAFAYAVSGERQPDYDFDLDRENSIPLGVTQANGRFYVVDRYERNVYAYTTAGVRDPDVEFDLDAQNTDPEGIVHARSSFYVLDDDTDRIFVYAAGGGTSDSPLIFLDAPAAERRIPENIPGGINVGVPVSAVGGDELTYSIGGVDAEWFEIVPETGQVRTAEDVWYDYETRDNYKIEVTVEDDVGNRESIDLTINLLDLVPACGPEEGLNLRTNNSDGQLTLRWNPVQPMRGQQNSVGYETEIRRGDTGPWTDRRRFLGSRFAGMVYAGLGNGIRYQVRVRAVNPEGECGWSKPVWGTPTAEHAPEDFPDVSDRHPRPLGTDERNLRLLAEERCRHTSRGVTLDGDCSYKKTGPDTGLITLEFDDPSKGSCSIGMLYVASSSGNMTDECFSAGVNTDVPFDTSFRLPDLGVPPGPRLPEIEPQRAPRDQEEFYALVHGREELFPGLCFGFCHYGNPDIHNPDWKGKATRIKYNDYGPSGYSYSYGDYTYENTGPSQGIVRVLWLKQQNKWELWSFTLDFEPSGNIRVTVTPPDGGEYVWPGMPDLDLTLGAQSVLLPIPPSWSAAIAIEADFAPELDWTFFIPKRFERALFGDTLDKLFGPPERGIRTGLYRNFYEKTGRNRGVITVEFEEFDPDKDYGDLDASQLALLLGSTWTLDLTFTSEGAAKYVLTITREGHLPRVIEGFVDFDGDNLNLLDEFPDELLPPDEPPQAAGEDLAGVEVAAAVTNYRIGADDVQTFLVSSTDATYQPGDWLEPKDGSYQRMMIVGSGQAGAAAAIGLSEEAVVQSPVLSVPADNLIRLSVVCMQGGARIPVRGARYFSRPKSPLTAVERCQRDCVLAGGDTIQKCVWGCEQTPVESAVVLKDFEDFEPPAILRFPELLGRPNAKGVAPAVSGGLGLSQSNFLIGEQVPDVFD